MRDIKGGALRKIYNHGVCLMISLHSFHPSEGVIIHQHQHER